MRVTDSQGDSHAEVKTFQAGKDQQDMNQKLSRIQKHSAKVQGRNGWEERLTPASSHTIDILERMAITHIRSKSLGLERWLSG